ncbi:putative WH2 domain, SCAR/WAVE family protein [Helianthus anomalus]
MPINRYQIRNVYSLADPELYKASDKDDPEALLEGVAMAGLVGVLRQLGDLAEFAAEIFHDLHEEVMATAARGHGLLVRVQQLESEIPPIERAFLSQTSHSAFFLNSGAHWHPNQRTTQNLITMGDLPRFVMDSYEECRGPPRLFLLDKFDVGGAGACLKRYTDPSIFKVEASSYEVEIAETQREKKIRQTKKKGSRWKGGETPEVLQSSHAKLHQLFLEERVQTGATEAARRVKLKKRPPNKFPLDSESGESYMNKLLDSASRAHEVAPAPSNGSRLGDGNVMESALGSPMKNTRSCVSSRKIAESQPSYDDDLEVDDNQTTVDNEIRTDDLQNAYPAEDVASETDNYMDALATMESEVETSITKRTYSDANKHQLRSQLSDSLSVENSTVSNDGNNSITKGIYVSGNSDTMSTSTENASPVGADSPSQPFACVEIPFRPRTTPITDNIPVTEDPGHDNTNDTYVDVSKVSIVDQVASFEEGTLHTNEACSDHTEKLDTSRKSDDHQIDTKDTAKCISEHSDVLPVADGLSSFSFVKNLKGDLDDKHPNDSSIPTSLCPNILETTKNQSRYDLENRSTDSVVSSSQSVISRVDELSSDTTFNGDNSVTEEQLKDKGEGVLVISDQAEARVSYSSGHETEIEPVTVAAAANKNECVDDSVLKDGTGIESKESQIELTYSDGKRHDVKGLGDDTKLERIEADSVNSDMETHCAVVLHVDVDRHDDNGHAVSEQDSKESGEKEEVDIPLLNSKVVQNHNHSFLAEMGQNQEIVLPDLGSQPVDIEPSVSNAQLIDSAHEATAFTESDDDLESKTPNHIDILEDKVDRSSSQLHMQLPLGTEGSQLDSLTQVDHETHIETHLQDSPSFSESVLVSEQRPTMELSSHDIISDQDDIVAPCHHESNVFTEADHDLGPKSLNHGDHIDVSEAPAQSSLVEDKVDQLHVPVSEKSSTMELSTHDINLFDQVKHQSSPVSSGFDILPQLPPVKVEDPPPLPPLPPMQWRMRKLQDSFSTPTNGGQHSGNHVPPFFSSTSVQSPEVVGQSTIDEPINVDTENKNSHTQHNEVKSAENLVPQAEAVDPHQMPTVSYQEVFWPSSSPYPLPPILDEMQINIRPMKIQRPRSPLIDAVAAHDKTKLRKVSDRDTIHIQKGDEKDTLLDQIRAKSVNLKPAVQTRPSIQGPTTNLRVAAILEKANAIRQAFAGSDDDDSDNWSDS